LVVLDLRSQLIALDENFRDFVQGVAALRQFVETEDRTADESEAQQADDRPDFSTQTPIFHVRVFLLV
jgi:hypothetical protein